MFVALKEIYRFIRKQKVFRSDNNFNSDSVKKFFREPDPDCKNLLVTDSNFDPDSIGVGDIIGFRSPSEVSTGNMVSRMR